ncbi:hypothetical protein DEM27_27500 [Metarhizobium album]|uniref:Solute-binding protein family 5 domain-containing protein n=1 Tax=Metarhizobium album TaxID=2182425 RepID=A0A2U2DIJ4_9HYPH|nr:extracellular solute-binding protein [Rhizobium album]PWE53120.1 hypothetical protein DEM27_27500 [Rhizobium album]
MALSQWKTGLFVSLACGFLLQPFAATAQDLVWRHALSSIGEPKLPQDFAHFGYVNTAAPKGGTLKLSENGTFDSFNPVLAKGEQPASLSLIFDTLMTSTEDEVITSYGLLAEAVAYPDDISFASFRLRPEAKWADGQPVTPEDVIFSFDMAKKHDPRMFLYYNHVVSAEKTGEREVTFRFDEKNNKELPSILGQFPVVPKHWWEGKDDKGNQRDISRTTLEPVMGSGPYRLASFSPGSSIRYELRDDYWAKDLNVNVGQHNFRTIDYTFYADFDVELEAFRAGNVDFRRESSASRWATGYDFPAVKDGRVTREEVENPLRATGIMQALVPNLRREQFKDPRVRQALNYAFDFEDLNRTLAYNAFKRIDSYFWGTELASSGLPQGRELEILEGMKDKVPAEVFTTPYTNPVGGDPQKTRENLRKAVGLLKEAGWVLKGNQMVNAASGKPMAIEILLSSPSFERTVLPFANSLKRIGIDARLRTVDASQYTNRVRSFDYDMIYVVWAETLNPGNEQADYWGSDAASRPGSRNYAGIADPAVDALIKMIIFAPNRDEQVAAIKAMDRVLLAHHFVVPLFYSNNVRIAYWNRITHGQFPEYGLGFPAAWWSVEAAK